MVAVGVGVGREEGEVVGGLVVVILVVVCMVGRTLGRVVMDWIGDTLLPPLVGLNDGVITVLGLPEGLAELLDEGVAVLKLLVGVVVVGDWVEIVVVGAIEGRMVGD